MSETIMFFAFLFGVFAIGVVCGVILCVTIAHNAIWNAVRGESHDR